MLTEEIAQVTAAEETVPAPEEKVPAAEEKVTLRSSDNEKFVVDLKVAMLSTTLKNLIDEGYASAVVPLTNVTGKILSKVIEYCKKHLEATAEENLEDWDDEFVDDVDDATLFDLLKAASYLDIKGLLDVTCRCVAEMIKGNTPEEMKGALSNQTKLTPEEEEKFRKENSWAFTRRFG